MSMIGIGAIRSSRGNRISNITYSLKFSHWNNIKGKIKNEY